MNSVDLGTYIVSISDWKSSAKKDDYPVSTKLTPEMSDDDIEDALYWPQGTYIHLQVAVEKQQLALRNLDRTRVSQSDVLILSPKSMGGVEYCPVPFESKSPVKNA